MEKSFCTAISMVLMALLQHDLTSMGHNFLWIGTGSNFVPIGVILYTWIDQL